jgi:hypothetical protein
MATDALMLKKSAEVLKKYSLGMARIPLEDVGCAPFNRNGEGISGKHAHSLIRRIVKEQGLVQYRYRRGLALSIDPTDSLAVARFTNSYVAKQSDLLSPVAMKPLHGSFAKTHLWHGLWTLKMGGKVFDVTGEPMEVPADHDDDELMETLAHGLFYEVVRYQAYVDHPDAVEALMSSDNFDAAQALADTEITLLLKYHQVGHTVCAPNGMSHFDAVRAVVDKHMGSSWTDSERAAIYNFSKVIGGEQLDSIKTCHQQYIDPKLIRVDPSSLQHLSKLQPSLLWAKAAIVIANLLAPSEKLERRGNIHVGVVVSTGDIKALQTTSLSAVMPMEVFIKQVMSTYGQSNIAGVSLNDLIKAHTSFLARMGTALAHSREAEAADKAMASAESKLRLALGRSMTKPLPNIVSDLLRKESQAKTDAASSSQAPSTSKGKVVVPDLTPALKFNEKGDVVHDIACEARKRGIVVGERVALKASSGSLDAGAVGVVRSVGDKVTVAFNLGCDTGKAKTARVVTEDLDIEALDVAPAAKKLKTEDGDPKATKTESTEEEDTRPAGVEWTPAGAATSAAVLLDVCRCGLYQAYVTTSLRSHAVRIPLKPKNSVSLESRVAKYKAHSICIMPFSLELSATSTPKAVVAKMKLSTDAEWTTVFLTPPPLPKLSEKKPAEDVVLFWLLQQSKVARSTLVYETVEFTVPLSCALANAKHKCGAAFSKSKRAVIHIKLPCLTNDADLPAMSALTVPTGPIPTIE